MKTTMVIADDHEILRDALAGFAARNVGFHVVGSVDNAQAAVNLCALQAPDLLLLDVEMPGRDPLAAVADVRTASPRTKVVILTAYCRDSFIHLALKGGASGYLLKTDPPAAIFEALNKVVAGGTAFSRSVHERISRQGAGVGRSEEQSGSTRLTELTPRELEVLRYIGNGRDNDQMAKTMSLSKRTVERHVARLMDSLAIRDRAGLQRFAFEHRLTA